jgi:hypothetical protein
MRRNIEDITEEIVQSIDKTILINKIFDGDEIQTTLYVCDVKWIKVGSIVSDEIGNQVPVIEVTDEYIVVDKTQYIIDNGYSFLWTSKKLTIIQNIYFMRGTALAVNGEWQKLSKTVKQKTPFVWLVKPTLERTNANGQGLERTSDLRLYFLDNTLLQYKEEEVTTNVIKPLWAWVMAFFKAIEINPDFGKFDNYDTRELSRFGTETPQGFEANIITANLSAIEVKFTLPIRRGAKCLCNKTIFADSLIDLGDGVLISETNEYIDYGN